MVIGMATKKVTITLDEGLLEEVRALVASGVASSVSGFVQRAVRTSLDDDRIWGDMLDAGLAATGGPMTDEEREWADEVLGIKPGRKSPAA
jgi:Arc/MetJ-type ribon-helix-helix transcriptional regulator